MRVANNIARIVLVNAAAVSLLTLSGGSRAQAPDEAPDALDIGAPATAAPARSTMAPARPVPIARPAPHVGQVIDRWKVVAFASAPRLPDGRPTRGVCGYVRDVVVRPVSTARAPTSRATLSVPCTRVGGRVAAAPAVLGQELSFSPADNRQLTQFARLQTLPAFVTPPGSPAGSLVYLVKVQKNGRVFDAHLVRGLSPKVDQAVGEALMNAVYVPAFVGEVAVDAIVRQEIRAAAGPPRGKAAALPGASPGAAKSASNGAKDSGADDVTNGAENEVGKDAPGVAKNAAKPAGEKGSEEVPPKLWPVPDKPFMKGELSNFGTVAIENPQNSIGVGIGALYLDEVGYLSLRPNIDFHYGDFHLGVGAPFRFEMLSTRNLNLIDPNTYGTVTANTGRFRSEDWDQFRNFPYTDVLRPLRYLRYGKKEDHLYVDVTRAHAQTIGHGQLMRRYTPNLDVDKDLLMAEVDGYLDFGGVELIGGPLPIPRLLGALAFIKPLGLFLDDTFSQSLSFGISYVTDLNTPTALTSGTSVADGRTQLAVDAVAGQERSFDFDGRNQILGPQVQGAGIDAEVKVFRNHFLDVKLYADYSHLFFPASDALGSAAFNAGGATVGGLFRLSFGAQPAQKDEDLPTEVLLGEAPRELLARHAFRFRVEGRAFDAQYLPSYFNALYETDKFQFGPSRGPTKRAALPTKFGHLAAQEGQPWRAGYYFEGSYQWVPYIAVTAVYEDAWAAGDGSFAAVPSGRNFALHAETLGLGWFQLFASYHFRNVSDVTSAFQFRTENEVFFSGLRWRILPFLFINLAVQRTFAIGFSPDDNESLRTVSSDDPREFRFSTTGLKSAWSGLADIEIGWQF